MVCGRADSDSADAVKPAGPASQALKEFQSPEQPDNKAYSLIPEQALTNHLLAYGLSWCRAAASLDRLHRDPGPM